MSVKEVQVGEIAKQIATEQATPKARTLQSISTTAASLVSTDIVSLPEGDNSRGSVVSQKVRLKLNEAIEATNVATEATEEISRYLSGIEGLAEQAQSPNLPPQRVAILEKEASDLRDAIKQATTKSTSQGVRPLNGDKIQVELEQTLGKTLEIILPDHSKDNFGLVDIQFSPKDLIVNTVAHIERARQAIKDLRAKLDEGVEALSTTVSAIEVAGQNAEASQATVRDVDKALQLASDTKSGIRKDPESALGSVGNIAKQATQLLD